MGKEKTEKQTGKGRTGPLPERLKIEGDWMRAVETSFKKQKPAEGWPKPKPKTKKKKPKAKKGGITRD